MTDHGDCGDPGCLYACGRDEVPASAPQAVTSWDELGRIFGRAWVITAYSGFAPHEGRQELNIVVERRQEAWR